MMASILLTAAMIAPTGQPTLALHLAAGLGVTVEQIKEPVAVDGVSITVQRVTGKGAPELRRRIEAMWRQQRGHIEYVQQGPWGVSSRLEGKYLEVLQWRQDGNAPELLWSLLDVQAPVQPQPSTGLTLPPACAWARSISGRSGNQSYVQRSARCPQSVSSLAMQLHQLLPRQGWRVRAATDTSLQVDRSGAEGFISLSSEQGDPVTWLTWLRVESRP